jgi:hypothetical protein
MDANFKQPNARFAADLYLKDNMSPATLNKRKEKSVNDLKQ